MVRDVSTKIGPLGDVFKALCELSSLESLHSVPLHGNDSRNDATATCCKNVILNK